MVVAQDAVAVCMLGAARTLPTVAPTLSLHVLRSLNTDFVVELFAVLSLTDRHDHATQAALRSLDPVAIAYADGAGYVPNGMLAPKGVSSRHWPKGVGFFRANLAQFVRHGLCWHLLLEHEARRGGCYRWVLRVRPDLIWSAPLPPLRSLPTNAVAARAGCVSPDEGGRLVLTRSAWSYHVPKKPADVATGCGHYENLPDDQFAIVPRPLGDAYFGSFAGSHATCNAIRNDSRYVGSRCSRTVRGIGNNSAFTVRPVCVLSDISPERCLCASLAGAGISFSPTVFSFFSASLKYDRAPLPRGT